MDEIFTTHIAGGAWGIRTTTQTTHRSIKIRYPTVHRRQNIGNGHRTRIVRMQRKTDFRKFGHQIFKRALDLRRVRHPSRVGNADGLKSHIHQPRHDRLNLCRRHIAFKRATQCRGDTAVHRDISLVCHLSHRLQLLKRLCHRHIDVRQVVAVACRQHGVQLIHPRINRPFGTFVVGYQCRVHCSWTTHDLAHHLFRISQLRDGLGMHKRCHLNLRHSCLAQPIDHLNFVLGRNKLRFDLKAIARAHFTDINLSHQPFSYVTFLKQGRLTSHPEVFFIMSGKSPASQYALLSQHAQPLIRTGHPQHVLPHISQDEIVVDGSGLVETGLPKLALNIIF